MKSVLRNKYVLPAIFILSFLFQPLRAQVVVDGSPSGCSGNTGSAHVVSVGVAQGPASYQWSTGQNTPSISNLAPGDYTVTVTDARNCKGVGSYHVDQLVGGLSVTLSVGADALNYPCNGDPPKIPLIASAEGGQPPYTFSPGVIQYAQGNGTYRVFARDATSKCSGRAEVTLNFVPAMCSRDPNEIYGPKGYGEAKFVSRDLSMPYTIFFENDPELAQAPAQKVVITHAFDPHVNRSSLKLGDFGFANMVFSVPPNTSSYSNRLDLRDSLGYYVDVTAGINITTNSAFWIFQTIDPATGLPPVNPMLGFLPVDDSLHKGEGFVSFTVKPRTSTLTGDTVKAAATIVFDYNAPIATNLWTNVVDAGNPVSQVNTLAASYDSTAVALNFTSSDDEGGSGVKLVELWVSDNGEVYERYGEYPPDTTLNFTGLACHNYRFFSIAYDHTGNTEADKDTADTYSSLMPVPVFTEQPGDISLPAGKDTTLEVTAVGARFYRWEYSTDGGISYDTLSEAAPFSGVSTHVLQISEAPIGINGYYFRCLAGNGSCSAYSAASNFLILSTLSGRVLYENAVQSPLGNTLVYLDNTNGSRVDSATTTAGGNFFFQDIEDGDYFVHPFITKTWGGVNATDALRVLLHFTGSNILNGIHRLAGDVNQSGNLNAIDALLIARRFTGIITSFSSGDWCSESDTVTIGTGNVSATFRALCFGDVDGSFVPSAKVMPAVSLIKDGVRNVQNGDVFELPLLAITDMSVGAVSLDLSFPAGLFTIEDVRVKNPAMQVDLLYHDTPGHVKIAWFNTGGMQLDPGQPLVTLKVRASERPLIGSLDFRVEGASELSDRHANVYENAVLKIPAIQSQESNQGLVLAQNYPNPFKQTTEISYYLAEPGNVSLKVFNPLGQVVKTLFTGEQPAGYYSHTFNAEGLMGGVYAVQLVVEKDNNRKALYKMMTKVN